MHQITVAEITIEVIRKDIKNLRLAVSPLDGRVRVATPLHIDDQAVRLFAISKLSWIKKYQAKFAAQERQSPREFVSGENHYFRGQSYLLNVVYTFDRPRVEIRNNIYIDLYVRVGSDEIQRQKVLLDWYRQNLKLEILPLIKKWEKVIHVVVKDWGVKRMKTKWGTCNIQAQRIWLNLELIKKSPMCLEYVVVHEMVHLLERHHGDRFKALMSKFMPNWKLYQEELNQSSLGSY